jgi:hypothetical protein
MAQRFKRDLNKKYKITRKAQLFLFSLFLQPHFLVIHSLYARNSNAITTYVKPYGGPHYSIHMASFCMLHQDKRKEDRWKSRTGRVERSVSHASKGSPSKAVSLQLACFLTSDVSSLCGELNQNNPGHLVCRTRIPREKRSGRGRKERSISGKHWITTKISLRLLCILPYLVKQRACCKAP